MELSLHNISPKKGSRTKSFRIGRGNASGRGTTAGKGTKGQRARTGGRNKLKLKGLKQMLLAFPKLRGFKSRFPKPATVTLANIAKTFPSGARIDLNALKAKELIMKTEQAAKVVGSEKIEKAFTFVNVRASEQAKAVIIAAGGSLTREKIAEKKSKVVKGTKKSK
jgi:large subunit ribosomal protein L15